MTSTNWAKMSWPVCVVPSQCAPDGGCRVAVESADGSVRTTIGPKMATSTKMAMMTVPAISLPECSAERSRD